MSVEQYFKALTANKRGLVEIQCETTHFIFFMVKEYGVYYDKRKGVWNCQCEFGSLWGKQEADCWHVKSCKIYLNSLK